MAMRNSVHFAGFLDRLCPAGGAMTIVQVSLPTELRRAIDREIQTGRVTDEADFLLRAGQFMADYLNEDDEIASIVTRADADIATGNYVTVTSAEQAEAMHRDMMLRIRTRLTEETGNV
jgi:Arc/MetJ-type ribon-helix-helix transcriptional regulator